MCWALQGMSIFGIVGWSLMATVVVGAIREMKLHARKARELYEQEVLNQN